jgi:hypothetical protein
MQRIFSLLKASVVAALVFALAWVRFSHPGSSLVNAFVFFIGYGLSIAAMSLLIGFPLVWIMERCRIGRWWSYAAVAAIIGTLIGGALTFQPEVRPSQLSPGQEMPVANPHALTFSPWTRDRPGETAYPPNPQGDFIGSAAFGGIVGGSLGLAFWYFYSRHQTYKR